MIGLVVGAVRARTAQAATMLLLTFLAVAVAAAAPWYGIAAATRAAAADVTDAPAAQRTVSARKIVGLDGDPRPTLDAFAGSVRNLLPVPDADPVLGMVQPMNVSQGGVSRAITVAYRDDFCDHVRLTGTCPSAPGDVALSLAAAQQLGLQPGARIEIASSPSAEPIDLRLTGTYELREPAGAYWSNRLFRADGGLDPAFVPLAGFARRQLQGPTLSYDAEVPDTLIRGDAGAGLGAALADADVRLGRLEIRLVNATGQLLGTVARDRATIRRGVLVATLEILVMAWFAIGLTGRYTGCNRRGDAALLKLRGSSRRRTFGLTLGQHAVPMLAGAVLGGPAGLLAARLLAGPIEDVGERGTAVLWCAVVVLGFLVGGLLVLAAVEAAVLRRPVAELLRQVPSGRRDWRADVVDLGLVAVAVAAVYQARVGDAGSGFGLVAPALLALAVALLLARLLGRVADRAGSAALRSGRLRFGLTAVQVSRQPGTDRVFALIVVAVALLTSAACTVSTRWAPSSTALRSSAAARVPAQPP
ncbi:FtsX-like permease family protein, partial [Actinoplanes sp. NPDC051633]|uniref:FtsX-like permease family protein n=1 Tax=Actinoplanes sp. NPDC051633 TaxID=3155670 RepID=UPI00342CAE10